MAPGLQLAIGVDGTRRRAGSFEGMPLYAAYGLRRLVSTWTGALVTVRRSSDNATLAIGVDGAGRLDMTALMAFAGSGSAFATQWWDQTGNGRHALQTTASAQPRLVNAGVVETVGSGAVPALLFDGSDDYLALQNALGMVRNTGQLTIGVGANATPVSNSAFLLAYTSGSIVWVRLRFLGTSATEIGGRRLNGDGIQAVSAPVTASTRRFIGRLRYTDAMADVAIDGAVTSGAFQTAGSAHDADSASAPVIGLHSSVYTTMSLTSFVLSQSALDLPALDAALVETLT